jgi:hypothetical protein
MRARWLLYRATGRKEHRDEARALLDALVAHAPPECRRSMLANVALHRDIAASGR